MARKKSVKNKTKNKNKTKDKTEGLIISLADTLIEKKALLLMGNTAVGKTFLARKIADELQVSRDRFKIISCHNRLSYTDLIKGNAIDTEDDSIVFEYEEKTVLQMISCAKKANQNDYYLLLFDDIQRIELSSLLCESIAAVGNANSSFYLNDGQKVEVPENFLIIATYNPFDNYSIQMTQDEMKHFYIKELLSDIDYVLKDKKSIVSEWYSYFRQVIFRYLEPYYAKDTYEQRMHILGHGFFEEKFITERVKYQIIPLLKQYIAEGLLNPAAYKMIQDAEYVCRENYVDVQENKKRTRINAKGIKNSVDSTVFVEEGTSHTPIINLISRIIEQGLLNEQEIEFYILFNSNICYVNQEDNGITYTGTLVSDNKHYPHLRRRSEKTRQYYNGGKIDILEEEFNLLSCIQTREFKQGKDDVDDVFTPSIKGETTSPNKVLIRILNQYYRVIINNLEGYCETNENNNKRKLLDFARNEWDTFVANYKDIKSDGSNEEGEVANTKVRKLIGNLQILWTDINNSISDGGNEAFLLEGVERKMSSLVYDEYLDIMNSLNVRQIILQGPPGTSKTYTAKQILGSLINKLNGNQQEKMVDGETVNKYKIENYAEESTGIGKIDENTKLVWDIVQFHPSYGYEDFIRGIEVSTVQKKEDDLSSKNYSYIQYRTVNKALGSIAELAKKFKNTLFFMIIDEINRANLATVFGELIYGLEYRNEKIVTPYRINGDNQICLPDNLYLIGTMNTADKSIGGIDYAIRRRFLFFEQLPDRNVVLNYNLKENSDNSKQKVINNKAANLFDRVTEVFNGHLSQEYRKEDVQIGHTYFLVNSEDELRRRFEYQIIPILKEYYKDGIVTFRVEEKAGFYGCIAGTIDMNSDNRETIDKIFSDLIQDKNFSTNEQGQNA